jgi:hypothetical protein
VKIRRIIVQGQQGEETSQQDPIAHIISGGIGKRIAGLSLAYTKMQEIAKA